jgi:hypothetical protein
MGISGVGDAERVVDWPDLGRCHVEIKDAFRNCVCPFRACAVDHVAGGQLFGCLDERPARRCRSIRTPPDGRRLLRVGEPGSVQQLAGAPEVLAKCEPVMSASASPMVR